MADRMRRLLAVVVVTAAIVAVGLHTRQPQASAEARQAVLARFGFTQLPANAAPASVRLDRPVAPALAGIRAWISAVGAAVALTDLRGAGRPADACLVDPRDDSVTVCAGAGQRRRPLPAPSAAARPGCPTTATMAPMGCVPGRRQRGRRDDLIVYYWGRSPVLFLNRGVHGGADAPATSPPAELVTPMQVWNTTALDRRRRRRRRAPSTSSSATTSRTARGCSTRGRRRRPAMQMQDGDGLARNGGAQPDPALPPDRRPGSAARRCATRARALPDDVRHGPGRWRIGLQDLTGDLLPEIYLANDFGPDQLLLNRSTPGRGCAASRSTGAATWTHAEVQGARPRLVQGHGRRLQRPAPAPGCPTIAGQQHHQPVRAAGEQLRRSCRPVPRPTSSPAGLPFRDRSEALGLARSGWGWDIKAGDFDNAGADELVQADRLRRGGTGNRWPQLQELAMGNDELLRLPAGLADVRAGRRPVRPRARTRSTSPTLRRPLHRPRRRPGSASDPGSAAGSRSATSTATAGSTCWSPTSGATPPSCINTARPGQPGRRPAAGAARPRPERTSPASGATVSTVARPGLPAQKAQLDGANGHAGRARRRAAPGRCRRPAPMPCHGLLARRDRRAHRGRIDRRARPPHRGAARRRNGDASR